MHYRDEAKLFSVRVKTVHTQGKERVYQAQNFVSKNFAFPASVAFFENAREGMSTI